jgi:hypothetical protein
MRIFLITTCLIFLTACGAGQSAKGPEMGYELPTAKDPNNGLLLVFRPKQAWRAAAKRYPEVLVDGVAIGSLKYNGYLVFEAPPGQHQLLITGLSNQANKWDFIDRDVPVSLKQGTTTYIQVVARFDDKSNTLGNPGMGHQLSVSSVRKDDARYVLPGMKLSE